MSVYDWSPTAADNDDADAAINWLEGQNPNTVNNSARAMMAMVACFLDQINGGGTAAGSSNAYTFTSETAGVFTAYADGMLIHFEANHENTGTATLNVDGLGAKTLKKAHNTDVVSGDIESGAKVLCVYDGTNFQIISGLANDNTTALEALTGAADRVPYFTSSTAMAVATLTSFARTLLDDADAGTMRTTLGLGALAVLGSINNGNWSGTDLAVANGGTGASDAATARTNLGVKSMATRAYTASTSAPSGGSDGDVHFRYV